MFNPDAYKTMPRSTLIANKPRHRSLFPTVCIIALLFLLTLNAYPQRIAVKESISATRKGIVLTKGTRLALSDSVRVERGGMVSVTVDNGVMFFMTAGTHEVGKLYDRKMKNLTHDDSLRMILYKLGVFRCDSIESARRKLGRSMHDAVSQEQRPPIQVKTKITDKYNVLLTWKGLNAGRYFVIGSDLMEEFMFVKETKESAFAFNGEPYPHLLIRIFAEGCLTSKHLVLMNKNGEMMEVR